MRKQMWFILSLMVLILLGACAPVAAPPYEVGSELVCPKNYDPTTSVCTVKQSAEEVVDLSKYQKMTAVKLGVDQVGIYRQNSETYAIYEGVGYHQTPVDYVHIYPKTQQTIVSDIDPGACGGVYNETTCIKALSNITLKGYQKFAASYTMKVTINVYDQENWEYLYAIGGPGNLLREFNNRSRDAFTDSKDIDPQKYIQGVMDKPWVAQNWLEKLPSSSYLTDWQKRTIKVDELSVRYFEPEKTGSGDSSQTSKVLVDQEFEDFLAKRDMFCAQFESGTHLAAECDRTFVCSQGNTTCYFGGAIIPGDELTPTAEVVPVATEAP